MNHSQCFLNYNACMYAMHQLPYSNARGTQFEHQSYVTNLSTHQWFFSEPIVSLVPSLEQKTRPWTEVGHHQTRHWSLLLNQQLVSGPKFLSPIYMMYEMQQSKISALVITGSSLKLHHFQYKTITVVPL